MLGPRVPGTADLSLYVPYTGATSNVNLGANNLSVANEAYSSTWSGSLQVPTKDAIYQKLTAIDLVSVSYFGGL
jgi:hypothetical protein